MIYDEYELKRVSPDSMDLLWEGGFRHFGTYFFRYSLGTLNGRYAEVLPLRINLENFVMSKSQRKITRRNQDLLISIGECNIDEEKEELFTIHAERFDNNKPQSIYSFLSPVDTANTPCELKEFCLYDEKKLVAVSFLDIGAKASSSVYAMFHPEYSKRSLGIYTLLLEIDYARKKSMKYLYPGYAYREASFYDYKKKFKPLEYFDWNGNWTPFIENNLLGKKYEPY